eukprot:5748561-Pyramimonas_sp.AAC.1
MPLWGTRGKDDPIHVHRQSMFLFPAPSLHMESRRTFPGTLRLFRLPCRTTPMNYCLIPPLPSQGTQLSGPASSRPAWRPSSTTAPACSTG